MAQITFSVLELAMARLSRRIMRSNVTFFDYLIETVWCVIGVKAKGYVLNKLPLWE